MCLHPYTIPNPLFNRALNASEHGVSIKLPRELSSQKPTIDVPCGTCADCRSTYFQSIYQRALVESRSAYIYFVSLTYDNKHIPSLILPCGTQVFYTNYKHVQDMFKRFRASNVLDRDFRYLSVNEYGDRKHRPHVHLLIFIPRLDDDSSSTPYLYEDILFRNLGKYFAVNVGTRKNPKYEQLFTYKYRKTPTGVKTNYFVSYVKPNTELSKDVSLTYNKTILYLLSYVYKGSSFDTKIHQLLSTIPDKKLKDKLLSFLRSKVRYSKGFGCGFNGKDKLYLPRISVRVPLSTLVYSEISDVDDDTMLAVEEFILRSNSLFPNYDTLQDFVHNLSEDDFYIYHIVLHLFPNYISHICRKYYLPPFEPYISNLFTFIHPYRYTKSKVTTYDTIHSPVYEFLRKHVDDGISKGIPYFCFSDEANQRYLSLCKYYRERVVLQKDYLDMYRACGAKNFDEWRDLFTKEINLTKSSIAHANELTHEVDILQPSCHSETNIVDNLYKLLINC